MAGHMPFNNVVSVSSKALLEALRCGEAATHSCLGCPVVEEKFDQTFRDVGFQYGIGLLPQLSNAFMW